MKRRRAVPPEGFEVVGSGVTLVAGQAVLRVDNVPLLHASVTMGFGEDGCGGDGNATRVAFDERLLLDENIELHGVEEQIVRDDGELLKRGGHGLAAGLIDVPGIDTLGIDFGDGPSKGVFPDAWSELRASFRSKFFRIVEAHNAALGIENDRGGDDRAEQGATAGFVETGDAHPAELSRRSLETGGAEPAHCAEILARRGQSYCHS